MTHLGFRIVAVALVGVAVGACFGGGGKSKDDKINEALNRGLQAHVAGQLDVATTAYQEVLTLDPTNKFAFYNLGVIDQTNGNDASAENRYRLALNSDPNFTSPMFNLAILRNKAGSTLEAIDLYHKVIAIDPSNAGAHLNLGFALKAIGQQQQGDGEISQAIALNPALASQSTPAAGVATPTAAAQGSAVGTRVPTP